MYAYFYNTKLNLKIIEFFKSSLWSILTPDRYVFIVYAVQNQTQLRIQFRIKGVLYVNLTNCVMHYPLYLNCFTEINNLTSFKTLIR